MATIKNILKDLDVSKDHDPESIKAFFMEEIWKDVPGYEGMYQVSNLGRVKSLGWKASSIRNGRYFERKVNGKILKGRPNKRSYLRVALLGKDFTIHQLVAMAFLGHIPSGMKKVVDHIDGDRLNNKLSNLRVVTQRQNCNPKKITSKYTGVHYCKIVKKYISRIFVNGKLKYLGSFSNEYDAHLAYQKYLKNIV